MSRIHDMGGRLGTGAVSPEAREPVFKRPWHARAMAITVLAARPGGWTIDTSRHARETLAPAEYMQMGYYEKWLAALTDLLAAREMISTEELDAGRALAPAAPERAAKCIAPAEVAQMPAGSPYLRPNGPAPRFAIGARVRALRPAVNRCGVAGGHTRLPSYAAGHIGRVVMRHGNHVLPDANAHGLGEAPEPLYTVAFCARDLWGDEAQAGDEVTLDLWQSYLEAADE